MELAPSTFWEHVYRLRELGMIGRVWKTAQLSAHLERPQGQYAPSTISINPFNSSVSMTGDEIGDFVNKGQSPKAWRVGRGLFQLVADPDDDEYTRRAQMRLAMERAEELRAKRRRTIAVQPVIGAAPHARAVTQPRPSESNYVPTPIPIALTESERQEMAGLSAEQKAMAVLRSCLMERYGHQAGIEEGRSGSDISVSIDGIAVRFEAERIALRDQRYPLRGEPYRYDNPFDAVAEDDWVIG